MTRLCVFFVLVCLVSVGLFVQPALSASKLEEQVTALASCVTALEARATAAEAQVASLSLSLAALGDRVRVLELGPPPPPPSEPRLLSTEPAISAILGDQQGNFAFSTQRVWGQDDDAAVLLFDGTTLRELATYSHLQTAGVGMLGIDRGRVLWAEYPYAGGDPYLLHLWDGQSIRQLIPPGWTVDWNGVRATLTSSGAVWTQKNLTTGEAQTWFYPMPTP